MSETTDKETWINAQVPPDLKKWARLYSAQRGHGMSWLVRELLEAERKLPTLGVTD